MFLGFLGIIVLLCLIFLVLLFFWLIFKNGVRVYLGIGFVDVVRGFFILVIF